MRRFRPESIFRTLHDEGVEYVLIGALGATLHGSPLRTRDVDICPSRDPENLERLATALAAMEARIRTEDAPEGLPFPCDAAFLSRIEILNLTTAYGDLDIAFEPAGTKGYASLLGDRVDYDLDGLRIPTASLRAIIRSKEAADRPKDRAMLPTLRQLLDAIEERGGDTR